MKQTLLYIHQLPQHLIGLILFLFVGEKKLRHCNKTEYVTIILHNGRWGVSLGRYVFVSKNHNTATLLHEQGHSKQSRMLGLLYLPVVGLPSIAMNILTRLGVLRRDRYYERWPESWADELGGVER